MKVKTEQLLNALKLVSPGLAGKEVVEQSSSFIFNKDSIMTYNDSIAVVMPFTSGIVGAVKADPLVALISRLKTEEVELTANTNELGVKAGKSNSGIPMDNEIRAPVEEIGNPTNWMELPSEFLKAVRFCLFSVARTGIATELTCLSVKKGFCTSTDNLRVTRFDMGEEYDHVFEEGSLLPGDSARQLVKYEPIEYALTSSWAHFRNKDGVTVACRIPGGKFPNVSALLEVKGTPIQFPKDMAEVLSRARIFGSDSQELVEVEIKSGQMIVSAQNDSGWFQEAIDCEYKGASRKFKVYAQCLSDMLGLLNKAILGPNTILLEGDQFQHLLCLVD